MLFSLIPLVLGPSANAATECFNESCMEDCSPGDPVGISVLVPSSEFPNGADTPIGFVDPDDGGDRRFIPTQQGAILIWKVSTQSIESTFFLDLRDTVGGPVIDGGERGLLAMAVDPDYATNGRFYVFYTSKDIASSPIDEGDVVISRFERSVGNPDIADTTETVLLAIDHPASNHNGGFLAFGPNDGFLYISTGDSGGGCDGNQGASGDGQSTDTLHGKMLRIDVRGIDPDATAPDDCGNINSGYTVPETNPFSGQEPACDEIWTLGLRNPFRFSFDRQTGDMYIGDVGQRKWEELNLLEAATPAPVNFGWVCREGCETAANTESNCSVAGCPVDSGTEGVCEFPRSSGFWDPVLCHYNGGWDSIMAGYRYRGTNVSSISGDYFYGDAACGQVWKTTTLDPSDPENIASSCWASGFGGLYGFAEDRLGELYIINGPASEIHCIHNGDGCTWAMPELPFFDDGFETGLLP